MNITIKSFEGASLKSDEEFPAIFLKDGSKVTLESCNAEGNLYEASGMRDNVQLIHVNDGE